MALVSLSKVPFLPSIIGPCLPLGGLCSTSSGELTLTGALGVFDFPFLNFW